MERSALTPEEEKAAISEITEAAEANMKEGDIYYLLNFRQPSVPLIEFILLCF
jgi:hypothetical protein